MDKNFFLTKTTATIITTTTTTFMGFETIEINLVISFISIYLLHFHIFLGEMFEFLHNTSTYTKQKTPNQSHKKDQIKYKEYILQLLVLNEHPVTHLWAP